MSLSRKCVRDRPPFKKSKEYLCRTTQHHHPPVWRDISIAYRWEPINAANLHRHYVKGSPSSPLNRPFSRPATISIRLRNFSFRSLNIVTLRSLNPNHNRMSRNVSLPFGNQESSWTPDMTNVLLSFAIVIPRGLLGSSIMAVLRIKTSVVISAAIFNPVIGSGK